MKQIVDKNGTPLHGLFRKDDGSVVFKNEVEFQKNLKQQEAFNRLNNLVTQLTFRVDAIENLLANWNKQ